MTINMTTKEKETINYEIASPKSEYIIRGKTADRFYSIFEILQGSSSYHQYRIFPERPLQEDNPMGEGVL